MRKVHIVLAIVCALSAILSAPLPSPAAEPADPRPILLILGDQNSLPAGNSASWCQLLQKTRLEWNIVVNAELKRTLGELADGVDKIITPLPHVEAVLVFTGTPDAAADQYAKANAKKLAGQLADLLRKGKATAPGAKAQWLLATPMPVVEARLDQWSKERFKGGEQAMKAIAEAYRSTAGEQGVTVLDFYRWAYDDSADGKPGRLVGTTGWTARDWAHPFMAKYFAEQLKDLKMPPPDEAAFALWQKERAALQRLSQILAETSEGLVAHGPPHEAQLVKGAFNSYEIALPPDQIAGAQLDLLFTSADKPYAAIGNGGNRPMVTTVLLLTVDGKELKVPLRGQDWQLIDEAQPDTPVDPARYRFNAQKMNYFGLTSSEEGKRRWMLARFDLGALAGRKPTAAKLVIGVPTTVEQFTPPDKTEPIPADKIGAPRASLITGLDSQWDDSLATWKTRDGKLGWTGGKIDAPRRKAALEAFLKDNPPPQAAARAASESP